MSTGLSAAAERNKGPILEVLRTVLPATGTVLEVASGTGQHVAHFAAALPGLTWQPTEASDDRARALEDRLRASPRPNVQTPLVLDVRCADWGDRAPVVAVLAINLVHIAPWSAAQGLVAGAARCLAPEGVLVLYGPYREGGRHTAPSNAAFDADLRARDPEYGIRDLEDIHGLALAHGFSAPSMTRMPANNLTLVFRRTAGRG